MRKSILSLIALFATFTCFADSETIDFTNELYVSNLTINKPNDKFISSITTPKNNILNFSANPSDNTVIITKNSSNIQYLLLKEDYDVNNTNINIQISVPTGMIISKIKITFKIVNFEKFVQINPENPDFTSNETVGTWNNINSNEVTFHATYGTQISTIELTYAEGTPTAINDASQEGLPYSVIASSGNIKVKGEWNSIRMFNSNGQLISANKDNVHCPAGTYLVQVNGDKAELVIVK